MLPISTSVDLACRLQLPGHSPCHFRVIHCFPILKVTGTKPVSLNRDIYPNLKLRIYTAGIRQNRLAKMIGIDEAYLSKIINGFREPSGNIRESIAEVLNSDPDWLFQKIHISAEMHLEHSVETAEE